MVEVTPAEIRLARTVEMILQSRFSNFSMTISAEIIPSLPYCNPQSTIHVIQFKISHIQLAEFDLPHYNVDILLGAEYYEMVLENKRQRIADIMLRNTKFDYVANGLTKTSLISTKLFAGISAVNIDDQMRKLWKLKIVLTYLFLKNRDYGTSTNR